MTARQSFYVKLLFSSKSPFLFFGVEFGAHNAGMKFLTPLFPLHSTRVRNTPKGASNSAAFAHRPAAEWRSALPSLRSGESSHRNSHPSKSGLGGAPGQKARTMGFQNSSSPVHPEAGTSSG